MPMHHDFPRSTTRVSWTGQGATANTNVTIEVSFYLDALSGGTGMYLWHNEPGGGGGSFARFVAISAADKLQIGIGDAGGGVAQYLSNESVVAGQWYHVVFVITSDAKLTPGNCKIYVKGGGFTFTDSGGSGTAENADGTTYTVGNRATDGARGIDGRIRRVRVWNNLAMSAGRVNEIFDGVEATVPAPNFAPDADLLAGAVAGSVTGSVVACTFGTQPTTWFTTAPPLFVLAAEDVSLGAAAAWADRAKNAVVSQGTAANRPTSVTDLGGRRAIRFREASASDGGSDRLMAVAGNGAVAPLIDRRNVTFVFIGRIRTLGEAQCIFASSGDSTIFGIAATGTTVGTVSHGSWNTGTLRAQSSTHLSAIVSNAGTAVAYVNNETASVASPAAGTANGGSIGQTGAGTNTLEAHVYEIHCYQGQLSAANIAELVAYGQVKYGIPLSPTSRLVINGSSTPKGWNDWTYLGQGERIVADYPDVELYNFSIEGRLYSDSAAAGSSDAANREDAVVTTSRRMILIDGYGSNDATSGGPNLATLQTNTTNYVNGRRTAGFDRVIKLIPQPRDFGGGVEATHNTRLTTVFEPWRDWLFTAGLHDRFIDPRNSPNLDTYTWGGDFTVGTYYADTTHLNTVGHTELYEVAGLGAGIGAEVSDGGERVARVLRVIRSQRA